CKCQHVFRPFVAQVLLVMQTKKDAGWLIQPGLAYISGLRPSRRTVSRNQPRLTRTPDRHADGDHYSNEAAAARDHAARIEHLRGIGIEKEPPLEQTPRVID